MPRLSLAIAAIVLAVPAGAADMYGVWDADRAACERAQSESRITITRDGISFWESRCAIRGRAPLEVGDAQHVEAACAGEGTEWRIRLLLMPTAEDGLLLFYDNGVWADYVRC